MAKLLIKYSTQSGEPQKLNYRELGIHNNHLYFGNSSNAPIRLAEYSDVAGGGKLKGITFGPGTGFTYTATTDGGTTRYKTVIDADDHGCGDSQDIIVQFTEVDGSLYRGAGVDYTVSSSGQITIWSDDSTYKGRIIVSGAVAPNATATWGSITGSITTQTDLVEYLNNNIPIATTSAAGIVMPSASGNGNLDVYGNSVGTLTAQMPNGSSTGGIYVNGTNIYATDGTWIQKSISTGGYNSLSFSYNSNRNYYSISDFNTAYIYPTGQNSLYPTTITIACYISSTSYTYNLKPVNTNGSTTATNHMLASSWDDIELKSGGWLVYTAKLLYSSSYSYKYLWTREVYSD